MDIKSLLNYEPAHAGHVKRRISKPALANAQPTQQDTTDLPRSLIVRFKHPFPVPDLDTRSTTQDTTEVKHVLQFKAPTTAQDCKAQDCKAQDCKAQVTQQETIAPTTPTEFVHFETQSSIPVAATPPTSSSVVPELPTTTPVKRHPKAPAIRQAPRTRISKPKGPKPKPGTKENPHPSEVKVVNGWTCFTRIKVGEEGAGDGKEQDTEEHQDCGNDADAMDSLEYAAE
ncbi:hypothetical protein IQ07DRAFT_640089 [Pyrenochaeta sp. DS3sAY3a]|nr:hypothetical protein IQ07DRAFT_640089 [Pyrenochaeta sp. DS3sAY3a]